MSRSQSQQPAAETDAWKAQAPPPPRPQPAAHGNGSDDYRRRLTEAIDDLPSEREPAHDEPVAEEPRRAPGDVYIQEGPPQLSPLSPATRARNRDTSGEPQASESARAARPIPAVDDFSPHAQREYWAKTNGSERRVAPPEPPSVYQRQPESVAPKTSLLRRLTGGGRGKGDRGKDDDQLPKHSSNRNGAGEGEEQVDLPVFFGRGKR
jgi:hypothetical protein